MKSAVTWILIADGSHAKIYQAAGRRKIEEKAEMATPHTRSRDLVADRPGRSFDSVGQGRHAMDAPTDARQKLEADFLRSISKKLDVSCQKKEFDRLIVIAEPRALGTLRQVFPDQVTQAIAKEIPHDLTGFTTPALETYLRDHDVI